MLTDNNEALLTEQEISTLFQDTSTDDEGDDECLQSHVKAL